MKPYSNMEYHTVNVKHIAVQLKTFCSRLLDGFQTPLYTTADLDKERIFVSVHEKNPFHLPNPLLYIWLFTQTTHQQQPQRGQPFGATNPFIFA